MAKQLFAIKTAPFKVELVIPFDISEHKNWEFVDLELQSVA
jgi:hypothetical protein